MSIYNQIDISDKDGWRKEFPLQKAITFIGCDPHCDIVLESHHGAGVALRHLQLLSLPNGGVGYRLVNLGDAARLRGASGEQTLAAHSSVDIANDAVVHVGEFTLTFHFVTSKVESPPLTASAPASARAVAAEPVTPTRDAPPEAVSEKIGAILLLPKTQLALNETLEGSLKVRNRGERPGAQFKIELEGWPTDAYQVAPGPVLFPNAEKEVLFSLIYPKSANFLAGRYRVTMRISAPEAYLGEQTTVSQEIEVLPQYSHTMKLVSSSQ